MPYKSKAQQRKFHALLAEGKISKETVDEYDSSSKGKKLPERIGKKGKGVKKATGIARLKSKLSRMK